MFESLPFSAIVVADFEYEFGGDNYFNLPRPVCMSWKDLRTGRGGNVWRGEFGLAPPFSTGADTLFVAYNATAEIGCFRTLGWPIPQRVLDLYTEFCARVNGIYFRRRRLIDAMEYFGLDNIGVFEKKQMIDLILRGPPWSAQERADIVEYCNSDIDALERLLPAMLPKIDLPHALLRGRFMANLAAVQNAGAPIDLPMYRLFLEHWDNIKDRLISEIDKDYGVYDGQSLRTDRFEDLLVRRNIPWPRLESGRLALDKDTFRDMAKIYPFIAPLRELRHLLSDLRLNKLAVGDDGRNRAALMPFASRSGRNQPSSNEFIFGPSVFLRGLIKPPPGYAVAYLDWKSQEVGIAAALSGDELMMADYKTGDPYIAFGIEAGILPAGATKGTHGAERDMIKACVLGVQYGMADRTLTYRINRPPIVARELIRAHKGRYRKFWKMADSAQACGMLGFPIQTVFGWPIKPGDEPNPRSMLNFPMQANGAEMMRVAVCLAVERGIDVVAPVHDALMIIAPLDRIDADVRTTKDIMVAASHAVLAGFEVEAECEEFDEDGELLVFPQIIRYPNRYVDKRGDVMWKKLVKLVGEAGADVTEELERIAAHDEYAAYIRAKKEKKKVA